MKIIQIRGTNGVGKTTVMRGFLSKHETEIIKVNVGGKDIECTKAGDFIIIGRYDRNECGGCDSAVANGEQLKNLIAKIMRTLRPYCLIFEGLIYGKTYSFTKSIYDYSRAIKADFKAICLVPTFKKALERVYGRNGGKEIDIKNLESGWACYIRGNEKLKRSGVPVAEFNTGLMTKEETEGILDYVLDGE